MYIAINCILYKGLISYYFTWKLLLLNMIKLHILIILDSKSIKSLKLVDQQVFTGSIGAMDFADKNILIYSLIRLMPPIVFQYNTEMNTLSQSIISTDWEIYGIKLLSKTNSPQLSTIESLMEIEHNECRVGFYERIPTGHYQPYKVTNLPKKAKECKGKIAKSEYRESIF